MADFYLNPKTQRVHAAEAAGGHGGGATSVADRKATDLEHNKFIDVEIARHKSQINHLESLKIAEKEESRAEARVARDVPVMTEEELQADRARKAAILGERQELPAQAHAGTRQNLYSGD